ncbi:MAG: FemAB family PEP-CTERM system-associated protein [Alphaproteobacteria bacterium]|nr:FemAB family PEP-CTERM system-associated protein [Alphaproteobacteria bacterium]
MTIHSLSTSDAGMWDGFVDAHPDATFFHRAGWQAVIETSFGHRSYCAYAMQNGEIRGVLPLFHVKNRLFGNRLVSTPFCVQGGPLVLDDAARSALDDYAINLADNVNAEFIEFRSEQPTRPDWTCKDNLYFIFRREIDPSPEVNLKAIPRKQRAVVRKAIKAEELRDEIDDGPDRFYDVYANSVRNLGTPVFSKKYCRVLKSVFQDDCEFLVILDAQGTPVSSVMQFYFRDEVLPYYGGGMPQARSTGAYSYMYWRSTCRAAERGIRVFDFGRSKKDTGAFAFKKNWGFEPRPLYYEYRLRDGVAMPDVNPLNPKYHLMINTWKRLPVPIANLIGPPIFGAIG